VSVTHTSREPFTGDGAPLLEEKEKESDGVILWNRDKTEAKLHLETYYGMLNGTDYDIHLRKFGDDWIVIELKLKGVS
jgi:hypothetical protein